MLGIVGLSTGAIIGILTALGIIGSSVASGYKTHETTKTARKQIEAMLKQGASSDAAAKLLLEESRKRTKGLKKERESAMEKQRRETEKQRMMEMFQTTQAQRTALLLQAMQSMGQIRKSVPTSMMGLVRSQI
jgi:siroheme synthase (precorrin-2 oxidase/ferrochelatase)